MTVHCRFSELSLRIFLLAGIVWSQDVGGEDLGQASCLDIKEIDTLSARQTERTGVPGINLAIVANGETMVRTYGFSDGERKSPMQRDAIFPIASVTKTFTAALTVRLASEGVVDLDTPVAAYLPENVRLHPGLPRSATTLRALLTHRSGWPKDQVTRQDLPLSSPSGIDPTIADPLSYNRQSFYEGLADTAPEATPLEAHNYSNLGFYLAGHVLELQAGRSYADLVREYITHPLSMHDTRVRLTDAQRRRIPEAFAYDLPSESHYAVPTWGVGEIVGGAGLHSTVDDLARWASLFLDKTATDRLLGAGAHDVILAPYIEFIRSEETWYAQGLGWRMSIFGPYGMVYRHNGNADGHNAFVAFSPEWQIAVVLLTNGSYSAMEELGNTILLRILSCEAGSIERPCRTDSRNRNR